MNRPFAFALALPLAGCSPTFDYETPVKSELRDPGSAQFSGVAVEGQVACGFVNSKNGYGGYAGKVPFVVVNDRATIISEPDAEQSKLVYARCPEPAQTEISLWITDSIIAALEATE